MIKLNLDYKAKFDEAKEVNNQKAEITYSYIEAAVSKKYPDGLSGQLRRTWGRIQEKLDKAIESKTYKVELETAEKDFIRESFKDDKAKYPVGLAKHTLVFEDQFINKLTEEK
jgi:hypothetical protein